MIAIPIYNKQGKSAENVQIAPDVNRKDVSTKTFACSIRALLQNWRQGTVGCKTRGELAFSNKKPWRQKGTGRARVSSIRSPLWRKGGVIFGPQPRVRTLTVNAKQKSLVFNNLLFSMVDNSGIHCLDFGLQGGKPQTKVALNALEAMGLANKKIVLFLAPGDEMNSASFRNLPNVNIMLFDQPNAFHLANVHSWVFFKKDLDLFNAMVARWI